MGGNQDAALWVSLFNKFNTLENHRNFWDIAYWEWTDLDDFMEKYSHAKGHPEENAKLQFFTSFYDNLGQMVEEEMLGFEMVEYRYGMSLVMFWEKLGPFYKEIRRIYGNPRIVSKLESRARARAGNQSVKSPESPFARAREMRTLKDGHVKAHYTVSSRGLAYWSIVG